MFVVDTNISTHTRVFYRLILFDQAWLFISTLLVSPSLRLLLEGERHAKIAARKFQELQDLQGNIIYDAHTAILMREHGIRQIYTRDTDFHRFSFLGVGY